MSGGFGMGRICKILMHSYEPYHYDPETKKQSMELRHSGSSRPKKFRVKNPLEKFSSRFFGIERASSSLIIFQRAKLSTRSITSSLLVQLKDIFKEKTPREGHQVVLPSNVLITHPILRMWPHRTTACSLDWKKKQLKGRNFSSDAKVIAAAKTLLDGQPSEFFFFFSGVQNLEQRAKKCIELRGEYVE